MVKRKTKVALIESDSEDSDASVDEVAMKLQKYSNTTRVKIDPKLKMERAESQNCSPLN